MRLVYSRRILERILWYLCFRNSVRDLALWSPFRSTSVRHGSACLERSQHPVRNAQYEAAYQSLGSGMLIDIHHRRFMHVAYTLAEAFLDPAGREQYRTFTANEFMSLVDSLSSERRFLPKDRSRSTQLPNTYRLFDRLQ